MDAAALVLGLHLFTLHTNHALETVTPGVYVKAPSGLTAGLLRNSYGRASVYAGFTFQTPGQALALTVGGITGYPAARVIPVLAPSLRIPLGDLAHAPALRLSFLPRAPKRGNGAGLNFGLEGSF